MRLSVSSRRASRVVVFRRVLGFASPLGAALARGACFAMGGEPTPRAKRSRDGASAPSGSGKRARARDGGGGAEISGDDASAGKGRASSSSKKKRRSSAGPPSARSKRWHPLPVRLDFGSAFSRHVFLRAASSSGGVDGADEGVALFVAAVPPRWTAAHLSELLSTHFGAVEDVSLVTLDAAPDVAGALARFERAESAAAALNAARRGAAPLDPPASLAPASSGGGAPPATGLERWVREFRDARRGGPDAVRADIDAWFEAHEREEARKAREAREAASADDGWTVVEAKRGRRKTTDVAGTAVGGIRAATADRRRNDGPKLRENFYRFQQREKRRGELYELKMRFEADKDRVAKLKASRKFRPT